MLKFLMLASFIFGVVGASSLTAYARIRIRVGNLGNGGWLFFIPFTAIIIISIGVGIKNNKKKGKNPYNKMDLYMNKKDPLGGNTYGSQNNGFGNNTYGNQNNGFGNNNTYGGQNNGFGSNNTYGSQDSGIGKSTTSSMKDDIGSSDFGGIGGTDDSFGSFSGSGKPFEDISDGSFDSGIGTGFAENNFNDKNW